MHPLCTLTLMHPVVNMLVHRNYFISAPNKLFIFSDRVEIHSPGCLPNQLMVDRIKAGKSILHATRSCKALRLGCCPIGALAQAFDEHWTYTRKPSSSTMWRKTRFAACWSAGKRLESRPWTVPTHEMAERAGVYALFFPRELRARKPALFAAAA